MSNKAVKERSDKGRERLALLDRNAAVDLTRLATAITAATTRTALTSTKTAAKGKRRADAQSDDMA